MAMEKTGDISSETPHPEDSDEKTGSDSQFVKASPTSEREADKMEDGPMARAADAVTEASKGESHQ